MWKRIKKAWADYLAHMEKSNKELFGSGTPDCCKLNSKQTGKNMK